MLCIQYMSLLSQIYLNNVKVGKLILSQKEFVCLFMKQMQEWTYRFGYLQITISAFAGSAGCENFIFFLDFFLNLSFSLANFLKGTCW